MSAISDSILSRTAKVDEGIVKPISNSKKIYVTGSSPDISVPMREISCSSTRTKDGLDENTPITVYDTSGPYTDPNSNFLGSIYSSKSSHLAIPENVLYETFLRPS